MLTRFKIALLACVKGLYWSEDVVEAKTGN